MVIDTGLEWMESMVIDTNHDIFQEKLNIVCQELNQDPQKLLPVE
jgi:hypothetical protein